MKKINYKKVKGYIEGYYGKLLSWKERNEILDVLAKNNMNFYFYCPKEDINHRLKWRLKYKKNGSVILKNSLNMQKKNIFKS